MLAGGIGTRDDFYWTLHAVLVNRREDHLVFDEAFRLFWKSRELVEKMLAMFSPVAPDMREKEKPRAAESRVGDAMFEGHKKSAAASHGGRDRGRCPVYGFWQRGSSHEGFRPDERGRDHRSKRAIADLRLPNDLFARGASAPACAAAGSTSVP